MSAPKPFAHLFHAPELGQILVELTTNDAGEPVVRCRAPGFKGLIVEESRSWPDTRQGHDDAEKCFTDMTADAAIAWALGLHSLLSDQLKIHLESSPSEVAS